MTGRLSKLRRPGDSTPAGPASAGAGEQPTAQTQTLFAEPAPPVPADVDPAAQSEPSFRDRGRYRRRLRYLRRVRELGFRDLGGLVFDLHRFGRSGDQLIASKLAALAAVDRELRALERVMRDEQAFTDLREPGIAACARCGALHGSDARFCPSCGIQLSGPRALSELAVVATPPPAPAAAATVVPEPVVPGPIAPHVPPAAATVADPEPDPATEVPVVPSAGPEPVTEIIRPDEAADPAAAPESGDPAAGPAPTAGGSGTPAAGSGTVQADALPVPPPPPVPPLPPGGAGPGARG